MKLAIASLILFASAANASCFGSGSYYNCTDSSGNNYTVNRIGNSTYVNGYNSSTGSNWSSTSSTYGNTTYQQGQTNGNSWNQTIQASPYGNTYSGTNSQGQSYFKTCTAYGCN